MHPAIVYGQPLLWTWRVQRNGTIRFYRTALSFGESCPYCGGFCCCLEGPVLAVFRFCSCGSDLNGQKHIFIFPIFEVAPYLSFLVANSSKGLPHGAWIWGIFLYFSLGCSRRNELWVKSGEGSWHILLLFFPGRKHFSIPLGTFSHPPIGFDCDLLVTLLRGYSFVFGLGAD